MWVGEGDTYSQELCGSLFVLVEKASSWVYYHDWWRKRGVDPRHFPGRHLSCIHHSLLSMAKSSTWTLYHPSYPDFRTRPLAESIARGSRDLWDPIVFTAATRSVPKIYVRQTLSIPCLLRDRLLPISVAGVFHIYSISRLVIPLYKDHEWTSARVVQTFHQANKVPSEVNPERHAYEKFMNNSSRLDMGANAGMTKWKRLEKADLLVK